MTELDLVHAQARLSVDYRMSAPHFNDEGRLVLRGARHPLLEALFKGDPALIGAPVELPRPASALDSRSDVLTQQLASMPDAPTPCDSATPDAAPTLGQRAVVPIDVNLGLRFQILVVTGPNTGGKTVALKTVGLLAIMAQSGLHVPGRRGLTVSDLRRRSSRHRR